MHRSHKARKWQNNVIENVKFKKSLRKTNEEICFTTNFTGSNCFML